MSPGIKGEGAGVRPERRKILMSTRWGAGIVVSDCLRRVGEAAEGRRRGSSGWRRRRARAAQTQASLPVKHFLTVNGDHYDVHGQFLVNSLVWKLL